MNNHNTEYNISFSFLILSQTLLPGTRNLLFCIFTSTFKLYSPEPVVCFYGSSVSVDFPEILQ